MLVTIPRKNRKTTFLLPLFEEILQTHANCFTRNQIPIRLLNTPLRTKVGSARRVNFCVTAGNLLVAFS